VLCLLGCISLLLHMTGDTDALTAESAVPSRLSFQDLTLAKIRSAAKVLVIAAALFVVLGGYLLLGFQMQETTIKRLAP
jgi:hypothetical protein